MAIDWNNVYLLGWYGTDGKRNLTSWSEQHPWIDVVVLDATDDDMPYIMWSNALHKQFGLLEVPSNTSPREYAKQHNGIWAFGWRMKTDRPAPRPLIDPYDWLRKMKGIDNGSPT